MDLYATLPIDFSGVGFEKSMVLHTTKIEINFFPTLKQKNTLIMTNCKLVFNIHFVVLCHVLLRSQIKIHPEKTDPISYFAKAKWYIKNK